MENLQNESIFEFTSHKGKSSIIKVIGVGGGGNNALKHMYERGIYGVDFIICNTDAQTLNSNPVANKVQLGASITEGLGAGADPEVGEKAAIESMEDIKAALGANTKMVFITAGMGGGTGTGAAPIVAKIAKEMGILTVAIVTAPFSFEGKRRQEQAEAGLEKLRDNVDSLIVINNDRLRQLFGNLGFKQAFSKADEVITNAAKGMAEVITAPFNINIDFRDAKSVLSNSGTALMSTGIATGENRAEEAVRKALDSPLLNDNKITGAKNVLLLIISGSEEASEATMDEIGLINDYVQKEAGGNNNANIIFGVGTDEELGDALKVLVIATGFTSENQKITGIAEKTVIPWREEDDNKALPKEENVVSFSKPSASLEPNNTQAAEIAGEKKVFKLKDTDEVSFNNTPINFFGSQNNRLEETEVLVEEKQDDFTLFDKEKETTMASFNDENQKEEEDYNLFSYNNLEAVSYKFDLSNEFEETNHSLQIEEEVSNFGVKEFVPEIKDEEIEVLSSEKEEEELIQIVEERVEHKGEFTIVEKKKPEDNSKALERKNKLREFNSRYQVDDEEYSFENVPAFKRRNLTLDLNNASEQKITSFYSEENGKPQLKENKFLNKDVD